MAQHTFAMTDPFLGSEALAARLLSRHELRSRYVALHPDVYVPRDAELTAVVRAKAAWLRSRRRGVLTGFSAAALHGSKWIDASRPAEIIDTNRRPTRGVRVWEERIESDEITVVDGMAVTTPARTALDLARRHPRGVAVAAIDALVQATELKVADVELLVDRYRGRHDIKAARAALALVDGGAQSPKESWLRVLLIDAGFPRPQTQIPVRNEWGWARRIWTWDGKRSRSPRSMTATSIARAALSTSRTSAGSRCWSGAGGSSCGSSPRIVPTRSSAGCATPGDAARNATAEIRPRFRRGVTGAAKRARPNQVGRRRLMSSAVSAASASTSAPSRTQPTLASPLMVS
ncbi:hypothetical protein MAHJHV34_08970 [Mycobacterium avium subsp. hominissuis]